jgi:tight adherence protein C
MLILIVLTALSVIVPNLYLGFRIKKRQAEISGQLPDVLDLICVSMEAGLGFDAALVRIGERLKGLLVSELNTVHSEIKLGKPRREALRSMSERNSVEELSTFIGSIIQAEQLGIPINNVLKTQAKEIREKRRKESQAKAMKAPVKMMLPLVMFIFPVLFIILLGPTIIDLIDQFG